MVNENLDELGPPTTVPIRMEASFDGRIVEGIVKRFLESDTQESDPVDIDELVERVVESGDFDTCVENLIDNWIGNSELYYVVEQVDDVRNDMADMLETIENFESVIDEGKDRIDAIEEKLSEEPEDSGNSLAMLILRVERLEHINERLLHIIHNVQGVELP